VTHRPAAPADLASLSQLAPELAAAVVSVSGDIALVIDADGVIRNVALTPDPTLPSAGDWIGRRWVDTVTGETKAKVEQLLDEVRAGGVSRQRREVNHTFASGTDLPMTYAAVRLGSGGPVLAVGRDLRAIAAIQQRFVESQQEMERDYWKRRQAESRYRLLFQVATDAVLMVDGLSFEVLEANRAAAGLFGVPVAALAGKPLSSLLAATARPAVDELLATARATGRPAEIRVRGAAHDTPIELSAAPFRADNALLLQVRARAVERRAAEDDATGASPLAELVERTPDGVVITDSSGRVLVANPSLIEWCQLGDESAMQARPLGDWVGEAGGSGEKDIDDILRAVRGHGIASQLRTTIRGSRGARVAVEVSAALLDDGEQERIGFTVRRLDARTASGLRPDDLAAAIEALALDRKDRMALPELVRAAAHLTERHLLKLALAACRGDAAGAARMLAIDVAALRDALRRHELDVEGDAPTIN
jgi:transcriptional regulator PpsR